MSLFCPQKLTFLSKSGWCNRNEMSWDAVLQVNNERQGHASSHRLIVDGVIFYHSMTVFYFVNSK